MDRALCRIHSGLNGWRVTRRSPTLPGLGVTHPGRCSLCIDKLGGDMIYALAALLSVTIGGAGGGTTAAPRCVAPAAPSDYMYTFSTTDETGSPTTGTVRVHGDRTRIDMDKNNSRDYILLADNGTRMMSVHPGRKEVDQINSPSFERIIGTSLRMVSPIVKFKVLNSKISSARVGTGQKLLGYATEQIRMTERFDVHIVAMGFDGGTEHHTVVTDYWVSPGLDLGSNPLLTLLEHAGTAMAQTDPDFVDKEASVRAQALGGTPLRTVVKETSVDDKGIQHSKTHSIDITSVRQGAQSAALFEIPSGYRFKSGMNISM